MGGCRRVLPIAHELPNNIIFLIHLKVHILDKGPTLHKLRKMVH
jgi:hypothetical protein